MLQGNVFITGGAGFLGRAIIKRAHEEDWPVKFTVYSRDETKQWELKRRWSNVNCLLGDVSRNLDRLIAAMHGHDTVIHAAAVKYIPEAEHNVFETIEVNIEGSKNVVAAAIAAGVSKVVGISTDKACSPLNLYGLTKGVMERMFAEANRMGRTRFVIVRYGNVVGSTGSVIPVFKQQMDSQGYINVTDPSMTRFWLSPKQAIDQILWAHKEAEEFPGHVFIAKCPAMYMGDLAKTVWNMNSFADPDIRIIGIRPGEKLHESLFNEQEAPRIAVAEQGFMLAPPISPTHRVTLQSYWSKEPASFITEGEMELMINESKAI